jgi:hypothetical protein
MKMSGGLAGFEFLLDEGPRVPQVQPISSPNPLPRVAPQSQSRPRRGRRSHITEQSVEVN